MSDRVSAAVWAALAGHTLGSTQIGTRSFKRLAFYEPGPLRMPPSPTLEAWLVFARFLASGEGPEGLWRDSLDSWAYATEAASFGRANMRRGIPAPGSGKHGNPFREDGSALGRAVFWGLVFPGNPSAASDWAFWDASFDHAGEGVSTAMACAACVAASVEGAALSDALRAATSALPQESQASKVISAVLQSLGDPDPFPALQARWEGEFGGLGPGSALMTFGHGLAGFAIAKDTASAVAAAAGFGGMADHSAVFAGAASACLRGPIAPEWTSPLGEAFVCGHGLRAVEPPSTLEEFVSRIVGATRPDDAQQAWRPALTASAAAQSDGVRMEVSFPESPAELGAHGWQAAVTLTNGSDADVVAECRLQPPLDSEIATKLANEALGPGQTVTKGIVVKRPQGRADESVTVHAGPVTLRLPVLAPQLWYVAGPFENESQDAFETWLPAEKSQRTDDRFNGRSGLVARWEGWPQFGQVLDVEPLFKFGPGAVVLCAKFSFDAVGPLKLVAAGSPGVVVRIDGEAVVRYNDRHDPRPGPVAPYVAEFTPGAETTMTVKLVRDRLPASPLSLYFLDQEGAVIEPAAWFQLPA